MQNQKYQDSYKMPKKISWTYGKKRYYGTFIRETKTHKFARTSSGKIKKIKKQEIICQKEKEHTEKKEVDLLKKVK